MPRMSDWFDAFKRVLVGKPIPTAHEMQHRLSKRLALPVFSADAISSTAYATEEILLALVAAGVVGLGYSFGVSVAVAVLLAMVAFSYQQTVHAYPGGGGSYIVGRENLGLIPGLVAAASLLVDYVMTVAVSVSSGVAALTAAFPFLFGWRVWMAVAFVLLIAVANLRGVRESGMLFAVPTYAFVGLCGALVVVGLIRHLAGDLPPLAVMGTVQATTDLGFFLVLRAFAGGCSAMTGTEAISNGVPVFRPPESRNAGITLGIMAAILGTLLLGVTFLAQVLQVVPVMGDTVLSQIGRSVFGSFRIPYFALQAATMAILIVGANTSFADFPRLSAVLARDGLMPRQFMNRGDRLVFSNGIIGLAVLAMVLIVIFGADTHRMIPLYAVGVFTSFTISQAGMARHWWRLRRGERGWRHRMVLNGAGAVLTGVVAVVVMAVKFTHGAFIVAATVPLLVLAFYAVHIHYQRVVEALAPQSAETLLKYQHLAQTAPTANVVMFVASLNELTVRSLALARSLGGAGLHAVTVATDPERTAQLRRDWDRLGAPVDLQVVESPYRELLRPAVDYVRALVPSSHRPVVVIVPELVVPHWWQMMLHNQDALRLKHALRTIPWVSIVSVPFVLSKGHRPAEQTEGVTPWLRDTVTSASTAAERTGEGDRMPPPVPPPVTSVASRPRLSTGRRHVLGWGRIRRNPREGRRARSRSAGPRG